MQWRYAAVWFGMMMALWFGAATVGAEGNSTPDAGTPEPSITNPVAIDPCDGFVICELPNTGAGTTFVTVSAGLQVAGDGDDSDGISTFGYLALMAAITPVVLGITEAIKRAGVDTRWSPFVAMLVGIAMAILFDTSQEEAFVLGNLANNVIAGVLGGLAASGLYSGVPTITQRRE